MTEKEAIKQITDIAKKDTKAWRLDIERCHINADAVLLQFLKDNGHEKIAHAYFCLSKRCGGFWCA